LKTGLSRLCKAQETRAHDLSQKQNLKLLQRKKRVLVKKVNSTCVGDLGGLLALSLSFSDKSSMLGLTSDGAPSTIEISTQL